LKIIQQALKIIQLLQPLTISQVATVRSDIVNHRSSTDVLEKIRTPYGPLFSKKQIPLAEAGKTIDMHFCNPMALLHHSCSTSPAFARIIKDCTFPPA
jgi:hypothetical protein